MRLGIVTDIHNDHVQLDWALSLFRRHQVDQVVTIGDSCDPFAPTEGGDEVAALLAGCRAVGVWGNHDFNLCREITDYCRERFSAATFDFMQRMKPSLELEGCHFSHKDASVDPHDVDQLWSIGDEERDMSSRATAAFAASLCERQFIGHYHHWFAATPSGPIRWDGSEPLTLHPGERYFVVIGAVFQGRCAIFDTVSGLLQPFQCSTS